MKLMPEHELTAEPRHPTAVEWMELTAAMTAIGQLLAEQVVLLEQMDARPRPWATGEQAAELLQELKAVRRSIEQTGEKKRSPIFFPQVRLPRLSPEWLLVPTVLLGLLALWYGGTTLWSGLRMFF